MFCGIYKPIKSSRSFNCGFFWTELVYRQIVGSLAHNVQELSVIISFRLKKKPRYHTIVFEIKRKSYNQTENTAITHTVYIFPWPLCLPIFWSFIFNAPWWCPVWIILFLIDLFQIHVRKVITYGEIFFSRILYTFLLILFLQDVRRPFRCVSATYPCSMLPMLHF